MYGDPFSDLEGHTIERVERDGIESITFVCEDGTSFKMYHFQDCCERVVIEDVNGDLDDLVGHEIVSAHEATSEGDSGWGHETYTFYHIRSHGGDVSIRWHGESNGYYSERVSIKKTEPSLDD